MDYDAFISHASEDKDSFVKPLAILLRDLGVNVWYDEFSLRLGDSLSRSIDNGLCGSKFGIVVISKSFISKGWPDYELKGLIAKEIGKPKIILPIWHGVTRDEVLDFSPSLADKFAVDTSKNKLSDIAVQLIEVIRPDLFQAIYRKSVERQILQNSERIKVELSSIAKGPIRHETLPDSLLVRIKLIQSALHDVFTMSLDDSIDDFRRDSHPEREIEVWEKIISAFQDATSASVLSLDQRKEIFRYLLLRTIQEPSDEEIQSYKYITAEAARRLNIMLGKAVPSIRN
jgi:hypothetical protein